MGPSDEAFLFTSVSLVSNVINILVTSCEGDLTVALEELPGSGRMVTSETNLVTILLVASLFVKCYVHTQQSKFNCQL